MIGQLYPYFNDFFTLLNFLIMHNTSNHLILSSSSIEGTNVRNLANEKLGEIKDIMLDVDNGRIAYAVLSVSEGFLGLDHKYFAIPWKALRFDTEKEIALLDVDKEKLENSPGFDKDNWPSTPQNDFVDKVHTYYGYESYFGRDKDRETAFERNVNDPMYNRGAGENPLDRDVNNPLDRDRDRDSNVNNPFNRDADDPNYNRDTDSPRI